MAITLGTPMQPRKRKTLDEIRQAERDRNSAAKAIQSMTPQEIFASAWNRKFYKRNTVVYVSGVKRTITSEQYDELAAMLNAPVAPMKKEKDWFIAEYEDQLDGGGFQS